MTDKDVIQHIKAEDNDYYSDDDLFKISSWGADLSFRELISRYEDDELVKPEIQRKYVWDKTEASRFIDSLLLGLPVPSIFLAKTNDEKMLIIDGFQRIMTVHDFVKGVFSGDNKSFKLSKSEKINPRWRGKTFQELNDTEQRRIRNTTIHAIIFIQEHPSDGDTSLYQVFERINTSGRSLLPQEIRNCVYQGEFNDLLFALNTLSPWRALFGNENEDVRMRDMELILRFFALQPDVIDREEKERLSLKKHLNTFMKHMRHMTDNETQSYREKFTSTINYIYETWGENAFHNLSPSDPNKYQRKMSPTIFDSITIAASIALESGVNVQIDNPEMRRRELLLDPDYKFAIAQETMSKTSIQVRVAKAKQYIFGL